MLENDVTNLNKNEVVISEKQAKKYNYKEGDIIKFTADDQDYEIKIVKIVGNVGLAALDTEFPFFVANLETINEIRNIENGKFDGLYIDVQNDDNVKSFADYLKENNKNS